MKPIVRTHRVENKLAHAITTNGGLTIGDALQRAQQAVEDVREECMAALDAKIAEIDAATASAGRADVERVYRLANEILSEAGAFGLMELSEAGRSLCELTSNWRDMAIDAEPIRVHVVAMKSLRRPDVEGNTALRSAVLEGLRQVTAKLTANAAA